MKKSLLLFSFVFVLSMAWAQERVISGKVSSAEDGSPLPGVNVVLKNTTNGTVTDTEGNFKLNVPASGGTLIFSFIGLQTQEQEIGEKSILDVALGTDVKQLTEVIVTAQGILKTKNELSYAAQTVSGDQLSKTRSANFANSLSGKVSGVQIQQNNSMGGSTNVIIRGFKSLGGNNQALFVIDGVPVDNTSNTPGGGSTAGYDYGNNAADINPDDIETTTILKGPAATALYGSRASNGVVYITTKKGRKRGLGVTINTGVTIGKVDKSTLPKYQKQYGGGYGQYYGPNADGNFDQADVDGDGVLDYIVPTYEDASVGGQFNPNLMVYQWNAFGDPTNPNYGKKTPWVAAKNDPNSFYETAVTYSNSVSVDGALADKGTFKIGYTRNEENGVQPNSKLKKDYLNFSASYNVLKNLTVTGTMNYSNIDGRGRNAIGYGGNNNASSYREWWEMNVDMKELKDAYMRTKQNMTWNWSSGLPDKTGLIYWDNPYWAAYENYESDNRSRYLGFTKIDWKITDWISLMGRISLDSYNSLQEERIAVGSVGVSSYNRKDRTFREYNSDLMLNVDKKLNDNFTVRGALGLNIRKTKTTGIFAATNGGLSVPGIYALSNSVNPINPPDEVTGYSDIQVNGAYANAEIGYKDFIFLEGSYRRDGASTLPKGNNSYGYFSTSTSFVFSELIKDSAPWLSFGKLRLNYAEVGTYGSFNNLADIYDKPTAFGSVPLFSVPGTKNNNNLVPERTKSYEIGTEMNFFDGRIGFDVNYFNSKSVNQILNVSVSTATGYDKKYVNAGELENKGWEVTLTGTPVKIADFKWDISVNWTRLRNSVNALYGNVTNYPLGAFPASGSSNAPLGGSFGTIYGTDYIYTNGERTVDATTGRYLKTTTVTNPIGSTIPDWTGGVQNTFSYKNVALSFLIDMKKGGDVLNIDMYYGLATGLYQETAGLNELGNPVRSPRSEGGGILLQGVNPGGEPNTTRLNMLDYPQAGTTTVGPTARYVYDASYVKLRELSLTYSLPAAWVAKLGPVRSVDLSAIGRNLWIIHKNVPYADPEDNLGAGNVQGLQVGSLPNIRTMGFNLKATF